MKKNLIILAGCITLFSCSGGGNETVGPVVTAPLVNATPQAAAQASAPVAGATLIPATTAFSTTPLNDSVPGLIPVTGGTFMMGSNDADASNDEKPIHNVSLSSFYIGKYEVSQKEYQDIMATNPSKVSGDNLPVEQVSWFDATKYCNARNKKDGLPAAYDESSGDLLDSSGKVTTDLTMVKGYRLPTEAEWEYAARGGNLSKGFKYAGSNTATEVAVFRTGKTALVGSKAPNELGIYDMSGNVWEWTTDWYYPYLANNNINPYISKKSTFRVGRGGSWGDDVPVNVRSADRYFDTPALKIQFLGFRIVRGGN